MNETNENSKPWYQSTAIIGAVSTGAISLASIFKIQLADLEPQINAALLALGTVVSVGVTIYGRIKAQKNISSGIKSNSNQAGLWMVLLIPCLGLVSCSTTSETSLAAETSRLEQAIPFVRPAVSLTCATVLNLAVSDGDRVEKANYIYGVAKAVRTLCNGQSPTVQEVSDVIALWSPNKTHWANLAASISSIYSGVYPLIKGDGKLALQVLEAIAQGCEDAASVWIKNNSTTELGDV